MKIRLVVLGIIAVAVGGANARAQLKAEPAAVDLGKRAQNQTAEGEVTLRNAGTQPVEILGVSADCSCTAATPEKTKLAPGEQTKLIVKSETRSYQGEITRRVLVQTSLGELVVPVTMRVSAFINWTIAPATVIMPPAAKGQASATEVTLGFTGEGKAEIARLTAEPAWVRAEVAKRTGSEFVVSLVRLPEAPAGNHTVRVTAETTDATDPRVGFNVFVPVSTTIALSPSPLVLAAGNVGQRVAIRAELAGWESEKAPRFELSRGEVTVLENAGGKFTLEVALRPEQPGVFTQLLRVYAGERLELEVPVIVRAERPAGR